MLAALLLLSANQLKQRSTVTHLVSKPLPQPIQLAATTPPPPSPSPPASPPSNSHIDLVVAADAPLWPGVAGLVRSVRATTANPSAIRVHLITLPAQVDAARHAMSCFGVAEQLTVVALPDELLLAGRVRVTADPKITGHLASPLNFARFYLPRLLPPSTSRVLYMDADIIEETVRRIIAGPSWWLH